MNLERSKVPTGIRTINQKVTGRTSFSLLPHWMAFTLMNDGPGTVKLALNEESGLLDAPVIASGEPYSLDMEWPTIYELWVEAEEGSSAYLRIFGKEGKVWRGR